MTSDSKTEGRARFARLQERFHEVVDLDEPARQRRLEEIRAEDRDLHRELVELLGHGDGDDPEALEARQRSLDRWAGVVAEGDPAPPEDEAGRRIGPYRVIRPLGDGGMGRVYEAEQTEPMVRRVALKVLREGLDSREILGRFEAERQALASMDHPSIARMLDAGSTEEGRPWFAMELVDGMSITDWADAEGLDLAGRIELILPVCDAVQHAHVKGVVHRDLKPSNILVSREADGTPRPRVIDFGIAKAIEQPLLARTLATRLGQLVGTPEYMSPEQATLGAVDVDTRSDVYSLGLVLYEMLVGELPLPLDELRRLAFDEICRRIREADTPRPSSRVGERIDTAATTPGGDTRRWTRQLRRDLDAVLLKALAKDRELRYPSAAAFADDLRRFLADEEVEAAPPTWRYRAGKLVRRHRVAVTLAAVALVAVVAGLVATSLALVEARRSEARTVRALRTSEETTEFLVGLFWDADPGRTAGHALTAREILRRGRERLTDELADEPEVRGRLLREIGSIHHELGDFDHARILLEEALAIHEELDGPSSSTVADDLDRLGPTYLRLDRLEDALAAHERSLAIKRGAGEGRDPLATSDTLEAMGTTRYYLGDLGKAAARHREALALRIEHGEPVSERVGRSHYFLGTSLAERGRFEEALAALERALEIDRQLFGDESRQVSENLSKLGDVRWRAGQYDQAIEAALAGVAIAEALYGPTHPSSLRGLESAALGLIERGRYDEAETLIRKSLAGKREVYGDRSAEVAGGLHNLGFLYQDRGDAEEAEEIYRQALELRVEILGPDHPRVAELRENLGEVWVALGRYDEAEEGFRRALRDKRAALAPDNPRLSWPHWGLGLVHWRQGRLQEAEDELEKALGFLEDNLQPGHPDLAFGQHLLANVLRDQGRPEEAEALYEKALEARSGISPRRPLYRRTVEDYAELLRGVGRADEARDLLASLPAP